MDEDNPAVILPRISGGMSALVSGESKACGSLKSIAPAGAAPPPLAESSLVRLPEK
ncbi:hypothetical protein D3C78_1064470 [compost metagenome]